MFIGRPRTRRGVGAAALAAAALATSFLQPQAAGQPVADDAGRPPGEAYAAMGYGVFLHYGLATFVGQTPWNYDPHDVPATVYDPSDFDPDQWMDAIEASGASYVILTAKHHDGFVMWPSDYSDYGVETSSDPDTDVVGEVVRAAREHGLEVVLYYSWHDRLVPGGDVRPTDPSSDRTASEEYLAYAENHIRELLTEYGHIAGLWMDIAPMDDEQLPELADFVHTVSPGTAFVPNFPNAIRDAHEAADVATFEGPMEMMPCDYEGQPAEQAYNVSAGPSWWQATENPPNRDTDQVLSVLSSTRALDATLSLNVSPGPSGRIPAGGVRLLEALGDRMHGDDLLADAATTASEAVDAHPAAHATDLLTKTYWQVPSGDNAWLRVELDQPLTIDRTAMQFTDGTVAGYEIQYRDADGAWQPAHTGGTPAMPTQVDRFDPVTTSALRLVVRGASDGVGVLEFKAYGGVDDTGAATTYAGAGWQTLARPDGIPDDVTLPPRIPWAGAFNDSIHRSQVPGNTATVTFTGNGVRLHASTGPDQGIARVGIDGGEPRTIDLYRARSGRDEVVYQRRDLEPGEHTITVEVTGRRNSAATEPWVGIDRITPLDLPAAEDDGPPFDELPDGRLAYDDGGDRCGADIPIQYVGSWSSGPWAGAYDDTRHYSRSPGAYAELAFEGTGVSVMTQTRPGHGIAAISVDGGPAELVDTYSNPPREQVVVWERAGLEPGPHTVRIEVTGDSNPASRNRWVALDAIIVWYREPGLSGRS